MLKPMPAPRAKEAPRFKGEYLKDFLDEFEILAKAAGISDTERCDYLARYCCRDKSGFDHKRFVKGLKEYLETDWKKLKARLAKCYPPEEEEFSVTKKALVKFIQRNRNIHDLASFDEYYRNFGLLANALEAKKKLKEDEKNSLFVHGIPYSLRKKIVNELLRTNEWKDKDVAPDIDKVIDAAENVLRIGQFDFKNMNAYINYEEDSEEDESPDDEERSSDSSESDEDEAYKITSHRHHTRKEKNTKTESKTDNGPKMQTDNAIEDINQRLDRLTIALERRTMEMEKANRSPSPSANPSRVCYMCGKPEAHLLRECPETLQFLATGVIKIGSEGRIVRANGTALPRGIPGGGGIAKVLKEEIMNNKSTTSNLELDQDAFLTANYEYAHFNEEETEYNVMPATRSGKTYEDERTQPYKRPENSNSIKKPSPRSKPEVVIQTSKPKTTEEVPKVPRILKRTDELPKKETPSEDVEMKDEFRPRAGKQKAIDSTAPTTTNVMPTPTNIKPKSKHVEFREPSEKGNYSGKPKRASPAFKFASEIQESVDHDRLLDKVLDGPANCTLREFMSTFEMSKRLQVITKIQKIPLNIEPKAATRTSSVAIEDVTDEEDTPRVSYVRAITAELPNNSKFPNLVTANAEEDTTNEDEISLEGKTTIPIIQVQRNEYRATARQSHPREVLVSTASLEKGNGSNINQFALRSNGIQEATRAAASTIERQGRTPQIPRLGNSRTEEIKAPKDENVKFGPLASDIICENDVVNNEIMAYEKDLCERDEEKSMNTSRIRHLVHGSILIWLLCACFYLSWLSQERTQWFGNSGIRLSLTENANHTRNIEIIERETLPKLPSVNITFERNIDDKSLRFTKDACIVSRLERILQYLMAPHEHEGNYQKRRQPYFTNWNDDRHRNMREYLPGRSRIHTLPHRKFTRGHEGIRTNYANFTSRRYDRQREHVPVERVLILRRSARTTHPQESRDLSIEAFETKLPEKETTRERSTSSVFIVKEPPLHFVILSNGHDESPKTISITLQSALEKTNRVYRVALEELPNMESSVAKMRESVQELEFMRNIRDKQFVTSDYVEAPRALNMREPSKTHNPYGEDRKLWNIHFDTINSSSNYERMANTLRTKHYDVQDTHSRETHRIHCTTSSCGGPQFQVRAYL